MSASSRGRTRLWLRASVVAYGRASRAERRPSSGAFPKTRIPSAPPGASAPAAKTSGANVAPGPRWAPGLSTPSGKPTAWARTGSAWPSRRSAWIS